MTEILSAAKKAINLGKQLEAVVEVGEFLEKVGALDLVADETAQRASDAVQAEIEAQKRLETTEGNLAIAQEKLQTTYDEREATEAKTRADRQKGIDEAEAAARQAATEIIDVAKAEEATVIRDTKLLQVSYRQALVDKTQLAKTLAELRDKYETMKAMFV